jgi:hypothetical protein
MRGPRDADAFERRVFRVSQALDAIGVERSAGLFEVEPAPVDFGQVFENIDRTSSLGEHQSRHAREELRIGQA